MRAYELTETISIAHLKNDIRQAIIQTVLFGAKNAYNELSFLKDPAKPSTIRFYSDVERLGANIIVDHTVRFIVQHIMFSEYSPLSRALSDIVSKDLGYDITIGVLFRKITANGTAEYINNKHVITLNEKFIVTIVRRLAAILYKDILDNTITNEPGELVENWLSLLSDTSHLHRYTYQVLEDYRDTNDFMGTIIHEIVHVIQHVRQAQKGMQRTEYRSYTQPNKDNFYKAIRAGIHGIDYYSSPQEIDAHSHNIAIHYIDRYIDGDMKKTMSLDEFDDYINDIDFSSTVPEYVQRYLNNAGISINMNNKVQSMVYRRYVRRAWEKISDYMGKIRSQIAGKESKNY